jgi:hypothetical protein
MRPWTGSGKRKSSVISFPVRRARTPPGAQDPGGVCFDCHPGAHLQALHAKFLHYSFAQNIGIEFAGFRKFDNSLGDQLIRNIAAVCKSKSQTSHFERQTHNTSGLGIEVGIAQKLRDGHGNGPAIGSLREAAPGGHGGRCAAGDPDSFGSEAVSRPSYVARCSNEVQLRTGP